MKPTVVDISKKVKKSNREIKQAEEMKLKTVKLILSAYEVIGLDEVDRAWWWLYNKIQRSIETFFEFNIGELNVPPHTKIAAQERIKKEMENLKKSKSVRVNDMKIEKEAQNIIKKLEGVSND